MSEKSSTQTLKDVLAKTDEQIMANWTALGSLIKNFENVSWQEASQMARDLLRVGNAMDYIEQVRRDQVPKDSSPKPTEATIKKSAVKKSPDQTEQPETKKKAKVIPMNTRMDRYSLNYRRLLKIAPDLAERLERGEEVYGKSKMTGYMDLNLELIHKNERGYYLVISHYYKQNGDMVPDPDVQILLNVKQQTVEALAFQNSIYYREVYDDIHNPTLVNQAEKKAQNSFLAQWLVNLDNQGNRIKWLHDSKATERIETQTKKPHVDDFPTNLVSGLRKEAENKTLGELRKALAAHLSGGEGFKPLEHFITAERINEITKTSEAKYPTQESLKKQSLEVSDETDKQKKVEPIKESTDQVEKIEQKPVKPDISFIDSVAIADAKKYVSSFRTMNEVLNEYGKHRSGEKILFAHVLYFLVERNNESNSMLLLSYPTLQELRRDYQKVLDERTKHSKIDEALKTQSKPSIYEVNYRKLLLIAPDLEQQLRTHQTNLQLRSEGQQFLYDLVLKVPDFHVKQEAATIMLVEAGMIKDNLVEHTAMEFHLDLVGKEIHALLTYLPNGEVLKVYEDINNLEGINQKEQKEQNVYLGKWLDELIEQGHKLLTMVDYIGKSEVVDEYQTEDEPSNQGDQPVIQPKAEETKVADIEKTAKHWKKLASVIERKEGLSKEAAKVKALQLKADGKAEDYLIGGINRTAVVADNQLLKMNYQKLIRLVPIVASLDKNTTRTMTDSQNERVLFIRPEESPDKHSIQVEIEDSEDTMFSWIVNIQQKTKKVNAVSCSNLARETKNLDQKFSEYLDDRLKKSWTLQPTVEEVMQKYPIVIEWSEGFRDTYIGVTNLKELRKKLKKAGFTSSPNTTYIKNKVWFKGYPYDVRIDVSLSNGDYNPNTMDLAEFLDTLDSNFDWYQFNKETSVKELQKHADEMPHFEVGQVQLTKQHKRAGLTQKHINWINKHKQGMIITPVKRMTNTTANFYMDMNLQAQRPGKRISSTGRIYYETRSNRSDMTNAGL